MSKVYFQYGVNGRKKGFFSEYYSSFLYVLIGLVYNNKWKFDSRKGGVHLKEHFNVFKEYIKGKKVAVIGIGVSNIPLIRKLVSLGAQVHACDKNEDLGELYQEFLSAGVTLSLGKNYLDGIFDHEMIFRSPSMLPTHEILVEAVSRGIIVTSEIAEFMKYCPCKMIGVTGSDGKTTTTTLVGEILKMEGYRVHVGGNIGRPLFCELENIQAEDFAVLELSSFQLMDLSLSPDVSIVTNISPNHLDIHRNMEEYIDAKRRIFQGEENKLIVVNLDNLLTKETAEAFPSKSRGFSFQNPMAFSYCDGKFVFCNSVPICEVKSFKLPGRHNVENIMAAFCAVYDYVHIDRMKKVAEEFAGVEHRFEFVRELRGIKFYNDSIASSPTRALAGLHNFEQKLILIAGGYDKKLPFEELAEKGIDRIKLLVLMGDTKQKIKEVFLKELERRNQQLEILDAASLEDAVTLAYKNAESGDIITMSPACASFDMYKNFEVRGNAFKSIVNQLK